MQRCTPSSAGSLPNSILFMQCYNEPFPHPCTIRLSEKCGFASGSKYSLEHKCIFPLFLFTSIRNFSKPALFPRRGKKKENLRFRERKLEEVAVIITRKGEIETKLWKIFNNWPVRAREDEWWKRRRFSRRKTGWI